MGNMKKEKLLIVGGGFIGKHLAQYAKTRSYEVFVIALNSWKDEIEDINFLQADVTNLESLREVLANINFEYVINSSGYIDHTTYSKGGSVVIKQHYTGVLNLVTCLKKTGLKKFIQIGSSDEYGGAPAPQSEDLRELPFSPYSFGKTAATHFLQMLHRSEAFPAVIIRLFLVYGPGQDRNRFLPQIISSCLSDSEFPVSEGKQIRDFCYIDDIVKGIFKVLDNNDAHGHIINLASGEPVSIRNMVETVASFRGKGKPLYGEIPYRDGENMELFASIDKAKNILDWCPEISVDDGIKKTISSLK